MNVECLMTVWRELAIPIPRALSLLDRSRSKRKTPRFAGSARRSPGGQQTKSVPSRERKRASGELEYFLQSGVAFQDFQLFSPDFGRENGKGSSK